MELIEVELIVDSLNDKEEKKDRVKGDKWFVSKKRLKTLLGDNQYHKCFVKETGEIKKDEEEIKEEVKEEPKKRKKKSE